MSLRRFRRSRATASLAALAVYGVPPVMGLLADMGHGLGHVIEMARVQQERAAALGFAHEGAARPASTTDRDAPPGALIHSHDGSTHAHGRAVGALLAAADGRADAVPEGIGATPSLALHLPASPTSEGPHLEGRGSSSVLPPRTDDTSRPAPRPRPPRA